MFKNGLYIVGLMLILIISGCSNDSASKGEQVASNEENVEDNNITVTDLTGQEVEFENPPKRIIPLSAGDLDTINALGGEVVGRPIIRGEVNEAYKAVPEIGTSKEINMEKIISLDPDLVVAHPGLNASEIPALEELGIKVIRTGATSVEDIQASITMFGEVLQKEDEAKILNDNITEKMNTAQADEELRTLLVFGVPGTLMVALPNTLSGDMLDVAGGYNISQDFPELDNYPGYAQLDTEGILKADPELILLVTPGPPEQALESLNEEIAKNPAWQSVAAVKNEQIVQLPNALFGANPGPKVVESLDFLHEVIESAQNK